MPSPAARSPSVDRACHLWRRATQTVFGEGSADAEVMLVEWKPRGKRRIHAKPKAGEIGACRPWLDAEIAIVHPRIIVCLGALKRNGVGRGFRGNHLKTRSGVRSRFQ